MLNIHLLRKDPEAVRQGLGSRGEDLRPLDTVLDVDKKLRELGLQRDETRAQIKRISKEVGQLQKNQAVEKTSEENPEKTSQADELRTEVDTLRVEADAFRAESKKLGEQEKQLEKEIQGLQSEIRDILLRLPNLPAPECPLGETATDNIVLRTSADRDFDAHQKVPHWDFAVEMGILDTERAVKLSGSMFAMFRGAGARLSNALIQLALERNRDIYEEIRPPSFVLTDTLTSTGHLPKFSEEAYFMERDGLWAIPTGEVPLTSLMAGEIIESEQLPMRLMAYTPCYRREAGAAGQQTRGMLRVHEFDKVEILAYAMPSQAAEIHLEILERAESIVRELGLMHRVVDICSGDLGGSSARTFDVEIFAPGADRWLECSSVSWFTDYQARRANIRYRNPETRKPEMLHTLNGSALAVPRVWAALVETHRQADGSIIIPEVLHPYMGDMKIIHPG